MIKIEIRPLFILLCIMLINTDTVFAIEKPQNPFEDKNLNSKDDTSQVKITTDKKVKKKEFFNPKTITIATSHSNNSIGQVICSLVNYNQHITGFNCVIKSTLGSLQSIDKLNKGDVDFAIAPASLVFDEIQNNKDKDSLAKNYRFVMALNAEVLNVLIKKNSKITHFF